MTTFGDRLQMAMKFTGMKPKDLCNATGLSQANVSHFVSGQREPSLPVLRRILLAMPKVDARYLILGEDK